MKLKTIASLLLLAAIALSSFACGDTTDALSTDPATGFEETTDAVTEAETLPPVNDDYDKALDDSSIAKDADGNVTEFRIVDPTTWVATDGLDRVLPMNDTTGDKEEERYVGIFYSSWHGSFAKSETAYNNQEILDMYPDIDKNEFYDKRWGSTGYHFWNEPIYGYYSCDDRWVLRRQAELLADAGVDTIILDNTNGTFTWMESAKNIMEVFSEAKADGVNAPGVVFMLPFWDKNAAKTQLKSLYNEIYSVDFCKDVWFQWDGKPLILMDKTFLTSLDELDKTLKSFFTFRAGQPDYKAQQTQSYQWGWLSMSPQAVYTEKKGRGKPEEISVGVAQNHDYVRGVITPMNGDNVTGRTYTTKGYDTRENAELYGANFAEQWEYALEVDPKFVFVTGWNEWVAMRIKEWQGVVNAFPDQFNDINSRDVEPTKGKLKDHYYYQMTGYIRQFKGTAKPEEASPAATIDIYGGYGQWADVKPAYLSYSGNTDDRHHLGYKDPDTKRYIQYSDQSGRNDIYDAKVAQNAENVFFMVRCVDDITPYTDAKWMRLYIDVSDSEKNWETFEYILNKTSPTSESKATLEAFTGEGFETEVVGEVEYHVTGNVLMVSIPRAMLGIGEGQFTLNFKWADNTTVDGDIMDFYVTGDVAPGGRFKYQYNSKS